MQFRYNPLHNLESLWWIAVYFVVKRVARKTVKHARSNKAEDEWTSHAHRKYAGQLFFDDTTRLLTMTDSETFRSNARVVHPALKPVLTILNDLRDMLWDC